MGGRCRGSGGGGGGGRYSPTPSSGGGVVSRRCSPAKVKSCLRLFIAHLFSHIGLCVLIAGYVALGALAFKEIEEEVEEEAWNKTTSDWHKNMTNLRSRYVSQLWNITGQFNVLYEMNWTLAVEDELKGFEREVAGLAKTHNYNGISQSWGSKTDRKWTGSGAVLYSVSIITTIGYGNTTPSTALGKVVTMLYAVAGVPLMLLWLSNIGNLMANSFKFLYAHSPCRGRASSVKRPAPPATTLLRQPPSVQVTYSLSTNATERELVVGAGGGGERRKRMGVGVLMEALEPSARLLLMECAEYNARDHPPPGGPRIEAPLFLDEGDSSEGECGMIEKGGVVGQETPSKVPLLTEQQQQPHPQQQQQQQQQEQQQENDDSGVPVSLVLSFVVLYILVGAKIFSAWEGWNFTEGAYFCFITLSTIGLGKGGEGVIKNVLLKTLFVRIGDYIPGKSLQSTEKEEDGKKLIACCLYLVVGLAVIAMSFNLVQEEVAAKVKRWATHIGIIQEGEEEGEEEGNK